MRKQTQTPRLQPSSNAENLRDQYRDNKVASDGRKLEDEEYVGARSPDSDVDVEAEQPKPRSAARPTREG